MTSYADFHYEFNRYSLFAIVTGIYSMPTVYILIKLSYYFLYRKNKCYSTDLHPVLFRQFMIMQIACFFNVCIKFLIFRIPLTGVMTEWCAVTNPSGVLDFLIFINYAISYSKDFSIILFCGIRLFLMFSLRHDETRIKSLHVIIFPLLIAFAFILALPRYFSEGECTPLGAPFPHGAMIISRGAHDDNDSETHLYTIIELTMKPLTVALVILSNVFMVWKLRSNKKSNNTIMKKKKTNAERVLTATMILILLPLLVNVIIALFEYSGSFDSIFFIIRSICIDAQAHIITCYFYLSRSAAKKTISTSFAARSDK